MSGDAMANSGSGGAAFTDAQILDELTKLNNEMATLQRKFARQAAALRRLNALKDQFLGMAAHDLRSPLGVITTYCEFLEAEASDRLTEEQMGFLRTIHATADQMLRLVSSLLDVAAIESGRMSWNPRPVDVEGLIRRAVRVVGVLASKKEVTIAVEAVGPLPRMHMDPDRLDQVLHNVLGNAVKFSPRGATVRVQFASAGDMLTIEIRDEGAGIPPERLEWIWRPFSKASAGTAGERGVGLGLAIARRIVTEAGGEITCESAVGKGTCFRIRLPVRPAQ